MNYKLFIVFLSLVSLSDQFRVRIIAGQSSEIKDYPYQLAYFINGVFACGGSILSDRFAMTAGEKL